LFIFNMAFSTAKASFRFRVGLIKQNHYQLQSRESRD